MAADPDRDRAATAAILRLLPVLTPFERAALHLVLLDAMRGGPGVPALGPVALLALEKMYRAATPLERALLFPYRTKIVA